METVAPALKRIVKTVQRTKDIQIGCIYAGIVLVQIFWHWFLSTHYAAARMLLGTYLYQGRWSTEGFFDLVLPGAAAGTMIGRIGWQWSARKLFLFAVLAGTGLVAVTPLYVLLLSGKPLWWWPTTHGEVVSALAFQLPKAWALVGVFTYAGYVFGVHAHRAHPSQ